MKVGELAGGVRSVLVEALELFASTTRGLKLGLFCLLAGASDDRTGFGDRLLSQLCELGFGAVAHCLGALTGFLEYALNVVADAIEPNGVARTLLVLLENADPAMEFAELADCGGKLSLGLGGPKLRLIESALLVSYVPIDLLWVVAASIRTEDRGRLGDLR